MAFERLDDDGNVTSVGDLVFEKGILGQGSTAHVRLARRRVNPLLKTKPTKKPSSTPSTVTDSSTDDTKDKASTGRKVSFLDTSDKTETADEEKTSTEEEPKDLKLRGYFARKVNNETTSDDDESDDDEPDKLVAVKIFNKSILKKMRTMERNSSTRRIQIRTAFEKVEREIALMKMMRHPNIVRMLEVIDSEASDALYMVLEYMPRGEIMTFFPEMQRFKRMPKEGEDEDNLAGVIQPGGYLDEMHAALYFVDILHGLAYLHQHHIAHRDLKPENILIGADGVVKISDFGVSHFFDDEEKQKPSAKEKPKEVTPKEEKPADGGEKKEESGSTRTNKDYFRKESLDRPADKLTRTLTDSALSMKNMSTKGLITKTEGTWCFWSPEMCNEQGGTFSGYAADVWAAGICLFVFVTGTLPFYSDMPNELFEKIAEDEIDYDNITDADGKKIYASSKLVRFLRLLLAKDPEKRGGVGDCLSHEFLKFARDQRLIALGTEIEKSQRRILKPSEEDIRKAFSIAKLVEATLILTKAAKLKHNLLGVRQRISQRQLESSQRHLNATSSKSLASIVEGEKKDDAAAVENDEKEGSTTSPESASSGENDTTPLSAVDEKEEEKTGIPVVDEEEEAKAENQVVREEEGEKTENSVEEEEEQKAKRTKVDAIEEETPKPLTEENPPDMGSTENDSSELKEEVPSNDMDDNKVGSSNPGGETLSPQDMDTNKNESKGESELSQDVHMEEADSSNPNDEGNNSNGKTLLSQDTDMTEGDSSNPKEETLPPHDTNVKKVVSTESPPHKKPKSRKIKFFCSLKKLFRKR